MPPGSWWRYTVASYSSGTPTGRPSRPASSTKYRDISASASPSTATSNPSERRFAVVCSADGCDVPFASGAAAVQRNAAPARAASRYDGAPMATV